MSPSGKRVLRYVIGVVLGAVVGIVLSVCFGILLILVCNADGGSWSSTPRHRWVGILTYDCGNVIPILVPLASIIIGIIWARRRNKRDDPKKP